MTKQIEPKFNFLAAGRVAPPGKPGEERPRVVLAVDQVSREVIGGFVHSNGRSAPISGLSKLS